MITGRWWVVSGAPPGAVGIPGRVRPGEWLREQRVGAGLTQEDLAELSGVSVRAIADLERGRTRRPYPSSVRALAQALGLPESAGAELVARYRAGGDASGANPGGSTANPARGGGETTVPRQLPSGVAHFAGRGAELAPLDAVLGGGAGSGPGVVISAIGGAAGGGEAGPGRPGSGRRRWRCSGRTRSPIGSRTGSSTPTCAGSTPGRGSRPIRPTCCAASSTRSGCTPNGYRTTPSRWPRSTV